MKRATFARGIKTAALVMAIAAIALIAFTSASIETVFHDDQFWTTLAAAGVGGFLGSIIFRKSEDPNR